MQSRQAGGEKAKASAVNINKHGRYDCAFPLQQSNFTYNYQIYWLLSRWVRKNKDQRDNRWYSFANKITPRGSLLHLADFELYFWFVDMSVAVCAASISMFSFIQITYSEGNLVESLTSFFHSQSLFTLPICLSFCLFPNIKEHNSILLVLL